MKTKNPLLRYEGNPIMKQNQNRNLRSFLSKRHFLKRELHSYLKSLMINSWWGYISISFFVFLVSIITKMMFPYTFSCVEILLVVHRIWANHPFSFFVFSVSIITKWCFLIHFLVPKYYWLSVGYEQITQISISYIELNALKLWKKQNEWH